MVDLTMPDGMSDEERVRWLHETGAALARETGQPSGATENQVDQNGQTVFGIWWTESDAGGKPDDNGPGGDPEDTADDDCLNH